MTSLKIYNYVRSIQKGLIIVTLFTFTIFSESSLIQAQYSDSLIRVMASLEQNEKPTVLLKLAFHYLKQNPSQVMVVATEAMNLSIQYNQYLNASESCRIIGIVYQNSSEYDSARMMYDRGLKYARKIPDIIQEAKIVSLLGYLCVAEERYPEALGHYRNSLLISKNGNHQPGIANALNYIGIVYQNTRDYDSSMVYYQSALNLFTTLNHDKGKAEVYNNMGVVDYYRGDYSLAVQHFLGALDIQKKQGNKKSIAINMGNIASIYQMMDNYSKALEYYEASLQFHKELQNNLSVAIMLGNIANLYQAWGKPEKSLVHFDMALEKYKAAGHKRGTAITMSNMGNEYHVLKQYSKAIKYQEEAIAVFEKINDKQELANALLKKSESLFEIEQINEAKEDAMLSIALAQKLGLKELLKDGYYHLATIYEKEQIFYKANQYYKAYMHIKDSILNENKHQQIVELQEKYEAAEKDSKIEYLNHEKRIQELKLDKQKDEYIIMLISAIGIIFMAAFVFYIYRYRYKRKEHQLITQNLEIEKKLLLMQMNPHFIFNSLNSIHGFITNKETDKAKEYLARFGNLMRLVLESSRKSLVVLEDEVEMLNLYLSLEETRFDGRFRYTINTTGLNTEEVFIPPMLIQPFAENAVKHGMKHCEDEHGIIAISFCLRNNHVLCVVEDNGPGINGAEKTKNQLNGSLGMKLTSERIEMLSSQWIKNLDLKVINISEEDKEKTGTRVEIEMPFETEA